ncbi:hypothetical protein ACFPOI_00945 [Nonomuraea angiospora]|uniref:Uncharacterized protein n=1 Tax=Nonomuraea angiospora TaxID=46172 RepID=A0ABR9M229_9ACTN|nr:hypothetical protein [Nonomuraea angiospora]MBE1586971.1 hypothetical protein [Nonomuraea angiospora]
MHQVIDGEPDVTALMLSVLKDTKRLPDVEEVRRKVRTRCRRTGAGADSGTSKCAEMITATVVTHDEEVFEGQGADRADVGRSLSTSR